MSFKYVAIAVATLLNVRTTASPANLTAAHCAKDWGVGSAKIAMNNNGGLMEAAPSIDVSRLDLQETYDYVALDGGSLPVAFTRAAGYAAAAKVVNGAFTTAVQTSVDNPGNRCIIIEKDSSYLITPDGPGDVTVYIATTSGQLDSMYSISGTIQDTSCAPTTFTSPTNGAVGTCSGFNEQRVRSGFQCQPTCNDGYIANGDTRCTDGVLHETTTCQPADCGALPTPSPTIYAWRRTNPGNTASTTGAVHELQCNPGYSIHENNGLYSRNFEARCVANALSATSSWQLTENCVQTLCPASAPKISLNTANSVLVEDMELPGTPGCMCPPGEYGNILPSIDFTGDPPSSPGYTSTCAEPTASNISTTVQCSVAYNLNWNDNWASDPASVTHSLNIREWGAICAGIQLDDVVLKTAAPFSTPNLQGVKTRLDIDYVCPSRSSAQVFLDDDKEISCLAFIPLHRLMYFGPPTLYSIQDSISCTMVQLDGSPILYAPLASVVLICALAFF